MTEIDFTGRTALVTGGTRGIGLAIARQLLELGANVAVTARSAESVEQAEKELDRDRLLGIAANAGDASAAEDVVHK